MCARGDAGDALTRAAQLFEVIWQRLSPAGFIQGISTDPLPGTPSHNVLIGYGLGDAQVSWLGAQMIGRTTGASMFQGNVREGNVTLFGFPFQKEVRCERLAAW